MGSRNKDTAYIESNKEVHVVEPGSVIHQVSRKMKINLSIPKRKKKKKAAIYVQFPARDPPVTHPIPLKRSFHGGQVTI